MAEAIRMPAVEGTQGTLAGTLRRPGDGASSCRVSAAGSGLYTTFRCPDAPVPQLPAHDPGQGADRGPGNVRYLQKAGVQLVAGAQGGDDGMPRCPAWAIRSSLQVTRSMQSAI